MDDQEAKNYAREIIKEKPIAVMATIDEKRYPMLRPMYTARLDDDFTAYFATDKRSAKCKQIADDSKVSLLWSSISEDMSNWRYAEITGIAQVTDNADLRHALWFDGLELHFPEGKDDPNYAVIIIKPQELLFSDPKTYPPYQVKL